MNQFEPIKIIVHEDSKQKPDLWDNSISVHHLGNRAGQHKSIELFLRDFGGKYYLHCEDDWEFRNYYNWIKASTELLAHDDKIIKVVAREGSPHPCEHKLYINTGTDEPIQYGYIEPWTSTDDINWHGFSWNPGVTRADLLKQFVPFPKWEQDLAEQIYAKGYKVVELAQSVYKHIGDDRSTH